MKVFVSINVLKPPMTGIGRYTLHLLEQLIEHPAIEDIKAYGDNGLMDRDALREKLKQLATGEAPSSTRLRYGRLRRWLGYRPWLRRLYRARLNRAFRSWGAQLDGYIYWEPGYFLLPFDGPSVATLYDLSHLRHPELHPPARIDEMRRLIPHTIATARRLITISEFIRDDLVDTLQLKKPVDLVSPGIAAEFFAITETQRRECREQLGLPPQFILSVATLEPRKNLARLLRAFESLHSTLRQRYPLVLAGAPGWHNSELAELMTRLQAAGELLFLGYVDQRHIPALYANATLLAYPSLYEGYGMPIAEAMASGCPVLTSKVSSMPEVAGDAAVLVDPLDESSIAAGLKRLLEDTDLRHQLTLAGKTRTQGMTWASRTEDLVTSLAAATS
ncbi:hypothetical protein RSA46_04700 [Pseudomonas oryzihabitans]|uniref:glycosyltransferase family 4 protein n=1 Tax=Pseudomonas rhizoryzae TaxID=2571129 RepID=UPI000736438A|nr:glycosyltransferase family 1 protein [Pseudomonas rhizoryzae]KTT31898.1 hypothetical protein NS201_09630 [Pseudomonas psychrotolerans]KTT37213.1 hypothetical protein SB9_02735 [Pseudomonas psychrotolerans]KTT41133.1 hypothetical protein SB5_03910 [Pseudomonas psychrotolerans]KTT46064.1 hypothetical protein RSA46_04700 [Pseudomonas psychrotolerans]KTT71143.1 hypothetical protein SB18R_22375 [Pseudomonas psychrotolerans]